MACTHCAKVITKTLKKTIILEVLMRHYKQLQSKKITRFLADFIP